MEENGLEIELETRTGIMTILGKKYIFRADAQNFYFEGEEASDFVNQLSTQLEKDIFLEIFKQMGEQLYGIKL